MIVFCIHITGFKIHFRSHYLQAVSGRIHTTPHGTGILHELTEVTLRLDRTTDNPGPAAGAFQTTKLSMCITCTARTYGRGKR